MVVVVVTVSVAIIIMSILSSVDFLDNSISFAIKQCITLPGEMTDTVDLWAALVTGSN